MVHCDFYVFLTEVLFGHSRWPTFIFPKVPGRTFFLNLSKFITFAAAPLVLTPFVRNRGLRGGGAAGGGGRQSLRGDQEGQVPEGQGPHLQRVRRGGGRPSVLGKGQMGSALMGSLRISCFSTEGLLGYSRWPTFIFPKVPGRTFFPNLSKFITFAAAPLVLTPFVRNQGTVTSRRARAAWRRGADWSASTSRASGWAGGVCRIHIYIYIYILVCNVM